jgi:GH24 family phage-related lysozyme (muramidase)
VRSRAGHLAQRPLPAVAVDMLESVHQHRLLSTAQLHALHTPNAGSRWTQWLLEQLERRGLVSFVRHCGAGKLWYLTGRGAGAVEQLPDRAEARRKPIGAEQAAGPLRAHTLQVNDAGIAFVEAAREPGHECGPLSWRHEIAHPIGRPPGQRRGELLIADALLTYLIPDGEEAGVHYRFLELDRATLPAQALAAKLARYARLHRFAPEGQREPAWRAHYPAFPPVLCLLTGQPRARLERRREHVLALCQADRELARAPHISISIALLEDLQQRGPFAQVFLELGDPGHSVDWLGRPGARSGHVGEER